MSTKIYNGLYTNLDFYTFSKKCNDEFNKIIKKELRKDFIKAFANMLLHFYDDFNINGSIYNKEELFKKYNITSDKLARVVDEIIYAYSKQDINNSINAVSFSFTLFPLKDKMLIIPFGSSKYITMFVNYFDLQDYAYYNNTDEPEDVTEEEWKQREDDWNEVLLDNSGVPALEGFSKSYSENILLYSTIFWDEDREFLDNYIGNELYETRKKEYISNQLYERIYDLLKIAPNPLNPNSKYMGSTRRVIKEYKDNIQNKDVISKIMIELEEEVKVKIKQITYRELIDINI